MTLLSYFTFGSTRLTRYRKLLSCKVLLSLQVMIRPYFLQRVKDMMTMMTGDDSSVDNNDDDDNDDYVDADDNDDNDSSIRLKVVLMLAAVITTMTI